jgi:hypothetical protein
VKKLGADEWLLALFSPESPKFGCKYGDGKGIDYQPWPQLFSTKKSLCYPA